MLMQPSARAKDLRQRVIAFMEEHIYPAEPVYHRQLEEAPTLYTIEIVDFARVPEKFRRIAKQRVPL